jgi:hypothetical protein
MVDPLAVSELADNVERLVRQFQQENQIGVDCISVQNYYDENGLIPGQVIVKVTVGGNT